MSEEIKGEQSWSEAELKELILFAQSLRVENEDLRAKMIAMNTMVTNSDKENKKLRLYIYSLEQALYEKGNTNHRTE
jgi:hypothetical protein